MTHAPQHFPAYHAGSVLRSVGPLPLALTVLMPVLMALARVPWLLSLPHVNSRAVRTPLEDEVRALRELWEQLREPDGTPGR